MPVAAAVVIDWLVSILGCVCFAAPPLFHVTSVQPSVGFTGWWHFRRTMWHILSFASSVNAIWCYALLMRAPVSSIRGPEAEGEEG